MNVGLALGTALLITHEPQPDLLRRALLETGYRTVEILTTVTEAMVRCRREGPQIEIVLYDLAPMDHDPFAEMSRLARRMQGVPLIVVTYDALIAAALTAGAAEVVARPLRMPELVARLRRVRAVHDREARQFARERKLADAMRRLQDMNRDLEHLACIDVLTGIANRRHSLALLGAECKRSLRERVPLAVAMVELDCFQAFSARYGRANADECLQRVSAAMVQCLRRPTDFVGRYGGDEFVVVLPNTSAAGAAIVADRLRAAVANLAIAHLDSPCGQRVTLSLGLASLVRASCTAELLIASAKKDRGQAPLLPLMVGVGVNRGELNAPRTTSSSPVCRSSR